MEERGYPLARTPPAGGGKLPPLFPAARSPAAPGPPCPPTALPAAGGRSPRGCGGAGSGVVSVGVSDGRAGARGRRGGDGTLSIFEPCLPVIYFDIAARCLALLCSQRDRTDTALAEACTLLILFSEALPEKPFPNSVNVILGRRGGEALR